MSLKLDSIILGQMTNRIEDIKNKDNYKKMVKSGELKGEMKILNSITPSKNDNKSIEYILRSRECVNSVRDFKHRIIASDSIEESFKSEILSELSDIVKDVGDVEKIEKEAYLSILNNEIKKSLFASILFIAVSLSLFIFKPLEASILVNTIVGLIVAFIGLSAVIESFESMLIIRKYKKEIKEDFN